MAYYANIIIDISHEKLDRTFQYRIPERLLERISPGVLVNVPFGRGNYEQKGFVIEVTKRAEYEESKLKEIASVAEDGVPVEAQLIALAAWMRRQYGSTMNQALKAVIPVKRKAKLKQRRTLCLCMEEEQARERLLEFQKKHCTARERLLLELLSHPETSYEDATGRLNVSAGTIRALEGQGVLKTVCGVAYRNPAAKWKDGGRPVELNEMQKGAVSAILDQMGRNTQKPCLLHGVTGSGKTEVYMELIAYAIQSGRQAIMLIPEISLTYQTVARFTRRFGERVSVMNSRLSKGERYDQFLRAKNGEIDIMIGPRSALFTPFARLGLIIIDEEHEGAYKSEALPRYHARETAVERARLAGAFVVLGSATPSVDSYYRAKRGEYSLVQMLRRVGGRALPECSVVDLREELREGNRSILSRRLQDKIGRCLKEGRQAMLFINRRGRLSFVSCRACGYVLKCPHCDVSLSLHEQGRLICHYCGHEEAAPAACPNCASPHVSGFRAGTQKIEEVVRRRFPEAKTLRMDFDTTRGKDGFERILSAFARREADILIGTQMIVKGHDFPGVTLVGVLAADLALHAGDYRAAERSFQLLTQAAGRAGRGDAPGEVVIQTYDPGHYAIRAAKGQDYEAFYEAEISVRRLLKYPPAANMALLLFTSRQEEEAGRAAGFLAALIQKARVPGLKLIGPASASVGKVNDVYRKVIYLKHEEYSQLVALKDRIELFLKDREDMGSVTVSFDFNPLNGM